MAKKIEGFGVVRMAPWHLVGIFPTLEEAQARFVEMPFGYEVHFGQGDDETDSFIWSSLNQ